MHIRKVLKRVVSILSINLREGGGDHPTTPMSIIVPLHYYEALHINCSDIRDCLLNVAIIEHHTY